MAKIHDLKRENIQLIRSCFYQGGIWTKNKLSEETKLSLSGTTNVLQYLLREGEILQEGKATSTGGRKSKQYILNPDQTEIGTIIVRLLDGKYTFLISAENLAGTITYQRKMVPDSDGIAIFDQCMDDLLKIRPLVKILSISIPGVCANGTIGLCDYKDFEGFAIADHILKNWQLPAIIENDANTACIGMTIDYPDVRDMAMIYQPVKDGFGCGILINGRLYNGYSHAAGELKYLFRNDEERTAREYLKDQIAAVTCVLNPQLIGYASDCFHHEKIRLNDIPDSQLPVLVELDDFTSLLQKGLFLMGKNQILKMHQ